MSRFPDPVWPVLILAVIQFGDAVLCIEPVRFVAECLEGVHWPQRFWRILSPLKFAAAVGLVAGVWIPFLAAVTCAALIVYFVIAISMHIAARDFGRNLFLNAAIMLVICVGTGVLAFF